MKEQFRRFLNFLNKNLVYYGVGALIIVFPLTYFCLYFRTFLNLFFSIEGLRAIPIPHSLFDLFLLPLMFPPAMSMFGICYGIMQRRRKGALACAFLCLVSLLLFIGLVLILPKLLALVLPSFPPGRLNNDFRHKIRLFYKIFALDIAKRNYIRYNEQCVNEQRGPCFKGGNAGFAMQI